MSFPDYEGKDYYESDQDEPIISSEEHNNHTNASDAKTLPVTSIIDNKLSETAAATALPQQTDLESEGLSQRTDSDQSGKVQEGEHPHSRTISHDTDPGALNDLLDDYDYISQPNTPGLVPAEFIPKHEPETPQKPSDEETSSGVTSNVTNIRRVDPNPGTAEPVTAQNTPAKPSIQLPASLAPPIPTEAQNPGMKKSVSATSDTGLFVANVMKALDPSESPPLTFDPPIPVRTSQDSKLPPQPSSTAVTPLPTTSTSDKRKSQESPSQSKSPVATDYSSANYWAQMKAQLKTKRAQPNEMSRNSSHKTGDEDQPRSSTDSAQSIKPRSPKIETDGRSGSFTSYTPIPRVSGERRPSIPTPATMGRGGRPTIDTNVGPGLGERRGSGSETKRPMIDTRTGNRSASNSPVIGSLPFSSNSGNRPSSRNRSREDEVMGTLPVFAPREALPEFRGAPRPQSPGGRQMRPASPARGRPQSPGPMMRGRPQSPVTSPVGPARSQSPSMMQRRPQSPAKMSPVNGPQINRGDIMNRTPSPLKDVPTGRTPSPLKDIPEEKRKLAPSPINAPSVGIPSQPGPTPLPTPSPTSSTLSAKMTARKPSPVGSHPPPPSSTPPAIPSSQPLSPKPERKVGLPVVPPIVIPPPAHESPSPDSEWKDETDEEDGPVDKRTTVFLQEASKRKDTLPPLPTDPPPIPPMQFQPTEPPTERSIDKSLQSTLPPVTVDPPKPADKPINKPLQQTPSHPTHEPQSPLIPPPTAPILERKLTESEAGSDSDSSLEGHDHDHDNPVLPTIPVPVPVESAGTTIPSANQTSHMISGNTTTGLSATENQRPQTPPGKLLAATAVAGETPIRGGRMAESPIHRLPELDVSRPITWGPLSFGESERVMGPLEDVEEEEDWEKDDEEESVVEPVVKEMSVKQEEPQIMAEGSTKEEQGSDEDWDNVFETSKRVSKAPSTTIEPDSTEIKPHETEPEIVKPTEVKPTESVEQVTSPIDPPDKGKEKEFPPAETPMSPSSPASITTYPHPTPRSKYIDRNITSFVTSEAVIRNRRDLSPPPVPKLALPALQTNPVPSPASSTHTFSLDYLPHFMSGKDIPEMSTVAQRVGAYQSRREQMIKADTGLRGWLLQIQQTRPLSYPQQMPPDLNRLSKESAGAPPSPSIHHTPFAGSGKVGKKVISKIKVGGKKIGAATKNTIDKLGDMSITGEKRSSGDVHHDSHSPEMKNNSGFDQSRPYSPESNFVANSPVVSRNEVPSYGEFGANTYRDPVPVNPELVVQRNDGLDNGGVGLGLSAPTRPYALDSAPPSASSLPNQGQSQAWAKQRPPPTAPGIVMSKKEARGHTPSSSFSGSGKVSKFFGSLDLSNKRHSGSSGDSPTQQQRQSSSPKQKSKFSRFMNDLSHQTITGKDPRHVSQPASVDSRPPPPPDKTQFRAPSAGTGIKNVFSDLGSRDITGARPQDKPKGARAPTFGSTTSADRHASGGGINRFFQDLAKRDLTGLTEEQRQAALIQQQDNTHVPAEPEVYDESASDWEVKMEKMEDVLPHIRRERLAEALKQAGGDEHRAIGLAVINSR